MHHVFVDANVLASRTLYDWLFLLRLRSEMYSLTTTPDVLDEAHRAWRKKHPAANGAMRARRESTFRADFDEILEAWDGGEAANITDVHDQHVHNAATYCHTNILLTENVRDFGDPDLLPYDLYAPDEFFCLVDTSAPFLVREVTQQQNAYWQGRRNDGNAAKPLAVALRLAGCPDFAEIVAEHLRVRQ